MAQGIWDSVRGQYWGADEVVWREHPCNSWLPTVTYRLVALAIYTVLHAKSDVYDLSLLFAIISLVLATTISIVLSRCLDKLV